MRVVRSTTSHLIAVLAAVSFTALSLARAQADDQPASLGLALVVLAGAAAAMSSPGFRLDWFVNAGSGGAGGPSSSANYAAHVTLGQTAAGKSASTNYGATLGYWAAFPFETRLYLPLVSRGP